MPSFSAQHPFTMPGGAALHHLVASAYAPALAALGVALALGLAGRATGARWPVAASGAMGALAGWMALLPGAAALRAVLAPRATADFLLLPAAAAALAGIISTRLRGRAERWLLWALAALAGWWLAGAAPARPEFWRVWLAVILAAWLLARGVGGAGASGAGGRAMAVALALWGGLLLAGAPPVWVTAALAAAAAGAAWPLGGALPPVLLAAVAAAADLGAGRLVQGRVNAADLACLLAPGAASLVPRMAARLGRAGRVMAVPTAAALTAGAAWLGGRLLHR